MSDQIDYGWLSPQTYGSDLTITVSMKANVARISDGNGHGFTVSGWSLTEYVRDRVAAEHCPRCGTFLRGALLTMNLQCEDCDDFDKERR